MKYLFAVALAACVSAPIAGHAASAHHHKLHRVGSHASLRAIQVMSAARMAPNARDEICPSLNVGNFEARAPVTISNNGW